MLEYEYAKLTGREADWEEYKYANEIYMLVRMSKQELCSEIKKHPWVLESQIVQELVLKCEQQEQVIRDYERTEIY